MKISQKFVFLYVWILSVWCEDTFSRENDKSDWIDPTDMLNFDMSTGKMKTKYEEVPKKAKKVVTEEELVFKEKPVQEKHSDENNVEDSVKILKNDLEICAKDKQKLQKSVKRVEEQLENQPASNIPYLKQYIRAVLDRIPDVHTQLLMHNSVAYSMTLVLSQEDLNILMQFVKTKKGSLQDAHRVMVGMIQDITLHPEYEKETWKTWIYDLVNSHLVTVLQLSGIFALCSVGILVQVRLKVSWFTVMYKLLLLLFIISVPWNWWHLYKIELAQRQAEALKDMPSECTPQDQNIWQILASAFSVHVDKCAQYHERMMVDPVWEVAPTRAIAVTITKFFLEPLEYIGKALGKFIRAPLEELPVHMWPFALVFVILVFILVLIMSFGYKIKLFYLFGLEPDSQRKQLKGVDEIQKGMAALTAQVEQLTSTAGSTRIEDVAAIVDRRMMSITGPQGRNDSYQPTLTRGFTSLDYVDSRTVTKDTFLSGHNQNVIHREAAERCPPTVIETVTYRGHTKSHPVEITACKDQNHTCSSKLEAKQYTPTERGDTAMPKQKGEIDVNAIKLNSPITDIPVESSTKLDSVHKTHPAEEKTGESSKHSENSNIEKKCETREEILKESSSVEGSSTGSAGDKESDSHSNAESFEVIADSDSEEIEDRHLSAAGVENLGSLS